MVSTRALSRRRGGLSGCALAVFVSLGPRVAVFNIEVEVEGDVHTRLLRLRLNGEDRSRHTLAIARDQRLHNRGLDRQVVRRGQLLVEPALEPVEHGVARRSDPRCLVVTAHSTSPVVLEPRLSPKGAEHANGPGFRGRPEYRYRDSKGAPRPVNTALRHNGEEL